MGKPLSEPFVRKCVKNYLESLEFPVIIEESASEGIRLDILAYKWAESGYGIEPFIVECKDSYDLKVRTFTEIIQDQISRYQDIYPNLYVAIPKPTASNADKKFYTTLCEFYRVGLLFVNDAGEIEERIDPKRPADEEVLAKMGRFSSFAAAILGFVEVFKNQAIRGPYRTWVSTKGVLQYNLWYDESSINFGVNIEDAKDLKIRITRDLIRKLSSEATEREEILVRKEKYAVPRRREYSVTLKKPLQKVGPEDTNYIVKLVEDSKKTGYNVHLNITVPLWNPGLMFGRRETNLMIESARYSLKKAYESFR